MNPIFKICSTCGKLSELSVLDNELHVCTICGEVHDNLKIAHLLQKPVKKYRKNSKYTKNNQTLPLF